MKKVWNKPTLVKIGNSSIKGGGIVTSLPEAYVNNSYSTGYPCNITTTASGCMSFTTTSFILYNTGQPGLAACDTNSSAAITAMTVCS